MLGVRFFAALLLVATVAAQKVPEVSITMQNFTEVLELKPGKDLSDREAIEDAIKEIVPAYNNIMEHSKDPHKRRATSIEIVRIDEVTFDRRQRALSRSSVKFIRGFFKIIGTCVNCKGDPDLINRSHGRRLLRSKGGEQPYQSIHMPLVDASSPVHNMDSRKLASAGSSNDIPSLGDLLNEQNKRIKKNRNTAVEKANELRAEAVRLAADAQIAEKNAEIHDKFVKDLDKKAKDRKDKLDRQAKKLTAGQDDVKRTLVDYVERLRRQIAEIAREITKAKEELDKMRDDATRLRNRANRAEKRALAAEKKALELAQQDAETQNTATAVHSTSIGGSVKLIDATFDETLEGFSFQKDAFRGTKQPSYVKGLRLNTNGDGVLRVQLGGVIRGKIEGMSGAFSRKFRLDRSVKSVQLIFDYHLFMPYHFEADEFSQVIARVNSIVLESQKGSGVVSTVFGKNDDKSGNTSSGRKTFAANLGTLAPGVDHTVQLGGYLSKKSATNEVAYIDFSSVVVLADYHDISTPVRSPVKRPATPPVRPPVKPPVRNDPLFPKKYRFTSSSQGFSFSSHAFGNREHNYSKGAWADKALLIELGGRDNYDKLNMKGGWVKRFDVTYAGTFKLTFRYRMESSGNENNGEDATALVQMDNNVKQLHTLRSTASSKNPIKTGWIWVTNNYFLNNGQHAMTFGGTFKKKTYYDEKIQIFYDDIGLEEVNV